MRITIEISDETEARLRQLAAIRGKTIEEVAVDLIMEALDAIEAEDRRKAAEADGSQQDNHSLPQPNSDKYGESSK